MEILNQFGINPILLAAQVVNFLILLFILKRFLYKPILKALQQRREKIAESLKNAEEIERKLLQTEEEREKALARASDEAQKIIDEGKLAVTQMIEEGRQKTSKEVESMLKEGQEVIKLQREQMEQEIRSDLSGLVVTALNKITGKIVNKEDQKQMIDKIVKGL